MFNYRSVILMLLTCLWGGLPTAYAKPTYLVAIESNDIVAQIMFDSLGEALGVNFEFIEFNNFSEAMSAVSSGYIDLFANVTFTPQRAKSLDFTAPTNIEYVYLFTQNSLQLEKIQTVAIPKSSTYHLAILEAFPNAGFVRYEDAEEAITLLQSGQVDGIVDSLIQLQLMTLSGLNATLFNDYLSLHPVSVVAPKGKHQKLLKRIENHAHSAKFQKLLRESVEQYQLAIRKQALRNQAFQYGININDPLRVKLENIKLFVNYRDDGTVDGITADTLFEVCGILQLDCQLESDASESWASMYQSLKDQTIDVLSPLAVTDARKEQFYLSDSYYSPEAILVKRKHYKDDVYRSISEMLVERIGVVEGNFFQSLLKEMLPGKKMHLYASQAKLLDGLLNKEVDYILITRAAFHSKLRKAKSILHIAEEDKVGVVYSYSLSFGFPKNEQGKALAELFSKAIQLTHLSSIVKKYNYPPDWYSTINNQKKMSRNSILRFVLIIALLLSVMFVFYRRSITDELTGLRNRLAIYRQYGNAFPQHKTLVYLDVNKFKVINDTYGHRVGDFVLKRLASNVTRHWKGDAYRIGGDEFVLVSRDSLDKIEQYLDKICSFSFIVSGSRDEVEVTVSVGMAMDLGKSLPLDEVLNVADKSMYKSKARYRHLKRAS